MKMRLIPAVAARDAWPIAGRSAAGAVLLALTVSACTAGGSSIPSVFTSTPQIGGSSAASGSGTRTPSTGQSSSTSRSSSAASSSASASASGSAHASSSGSAHASSSGSARASSSSTPRATPRATATSAHTAASAIPTFPTAAPETGGGGAAGLQDGLLFGVGGAAVLAGLGTFVVRRRLARRFAADPADEQGSATRESADR